jgi:ribonuclease P protein component
MPDPDKGTSKKKHGFPKSERLYLNDEIEHLFRKGKRFRYSPLKIQYHFLDSGDAKSPLEVLISVPKKYHRTAVKRNRIKRLIREAWRQHKQPLVDGLNNNGQNLMVAVIFLAPDVPDYHEIESKIILTLQRLIELSSNESVV